MTPLLQEIRQIGFELSIQKSNSDIFTNIRSHNTYEETMKIESTELEINKQIKYLAIVLDKKFTWKPYIDHIRTTCNNDIYFLNMT